LGALTKKGKHIEICRFGSRYNFLLLQTVLVVVRKVNLKEKE